MSSANNRHFEQFRTFLISLMKKKKSNADKWSLWGPPDNTFVELDVKCSYLRSCNG